MKTRLYAVLILLLTGLIAFGVWRGEQGSSTRWHFHLGLDLKGGTSLTYKADVSKIDPSQVKDSMSSLRDVIETRVNLFGVGEPVVQVEEAGIVAGSNAAEERLIVELPGVTDVKEAIDRIGKTPLLEFRELVPLISTSDIKNNNISLTASTTYDFVATGLTGRYLQKASLDFNPTTGAPIITLTFNKEGADLFAKITQENIGKPVGIYLDGQVLSAPTVQEAIKDGKAQITGSFKLAEAQKLVRDLNYGSLPVPISLISTETVGATLGDSVLQAGILAALYGLLAIAIFLVFWYRMPGLIAVLSLATYVIFMLALFKLIPVTITAAGIAGFILSMGMAVDANILIFERMKEELRAGRTLPDAVREGFARAWNSIRDGNLSGLIASVILFWLGTSLVKGFALTLGIGIIVSMLTAVIVSRTYLLSITPQNAGRIARVLFGSGLKN